MNDIPSNYDCDTQAILIVKLRVFKTYSLLIRLYFTILGRCCPSRESFSLVG